MRVSDWSSDVCSSDLQIEPEGMKCPDPEFGRSLRQSARQALRKLASGPVREGEDEHRRRIDSLRSQRGHALDERSEEHTSELQSLMRSSYAVFCLKKKTRNKRTVTLNDTLIIQ